MRLAGGGKYFVAVGLGWTTLSPLTGQDIALSGIVRDAVTRRPVPAVSLVVDDTVLTVTDQDGLFAVTNAPRANFTVVFRRIGYDEQRVSVRTTAGRTVNLQVELQPAPTTLTEIIVEGEPVRFINPGLVGFYNRRADGSGRFLTSAEISRSLSFGLGYYFLRRLRIPERDLAVPQRGRGCLAAYLDGMRMWDVGDISRLIAPRQVAGIEYHLEHQVQQLPAEFIPAGPHCGVVMIWTHEPQGPSPWAVGVRIGTDATGGQVIMPGSELAALRVGFEAVRSGEDRWRVFFGPAFTFGHVYAGVGAMAVKKRRGEDLKAQGAILAGVSAPLSVLAPFLEARLRTTFRQAHVDLAVGINLRLLPP